MLNGTWGHFHNFYVNTKINGPFIHPTSWFRALFYVSLKVTVLHKTHMVPLPPPPQMLGIPVSSALQSAVKQVAISSGQILVAKGSPSASKVMGGKQVLAQGVAKAIVSGAGSISGQQASAKAAGGSSGKSGGQSTHQHAVVKF